MLNSVNRAKSGWKAGLLESILNFLDILAKLALFSSFFTTASTFSKVALVEAPVEDSNLFAFFPWDFLSLFFDDSESSYPVAFTLSEEKLDDELEDVLFSVTEELTAPSAEALECDSNEP